MLVFMNATMASPEVVLKAGKVYDMPNRLATFVLGLDPKRPCGVPALNAEAGPVKLMPAGEKYDERKHGKRPILKVPARPDPQSIEREEVEPEIEYMED